MIDSDLTKLDSHVNADLALVHRGRWVNLTFTLGVGEVDYLITINQGKITKITERKLQTISGRFSIRADVPPGTNLAKTPERDYHDIFAMLAKGLVTIDGDLAHSCNLQYFKDLISKNRDS